MVLKLLVIHPEQEFRDFIQAYLTYKGHLAKTAADCIDGFSAAIHMKPHLIIINKDFKGLDAKGFLIKKIVNKVTENLPVFVLGDFSPIEIVEFKKMNVMAFISQPVNPVILTERISQLFGHSLPPVKKTTPMLFDLHARGNIIVIQVEGNLEPEKIEIMHYLIRKFCHEKEISRPRLFYIVPSLYPECLTDENIALLFKIRTFPELTIPVEHIKLLTGVGKLEEIIRQDLDLKQIETVSDFFSGLQTLQLDFDKKKSIPVEFLKKGFIYIFDLFDTGGKRIIPSLSPVTGQMLDYIRENGVSYVSYYSDMEPEEIEKDAEDFDALTDEERAMNTLLGAYEPITQDTGSISTWDDKLTLFFRSLKGQKVLVFTPNPELKSIIKRDLEVYFKIKFHENGDDFSTEFERESYSLMFLDSSIGDEPIVTALKKIREKASRRKTSIIILADHIHKASVIRFRDAGTDNIIATPFTARRLLLKIFDSISADRRT
ncbi:MAG: hypothetical protein JW904_08050 [Spirochaetales bacterium]|nr:hypothetical protein [Spirochaetales bacterium]